MEKAIAAEEFVRVVLMLVKLHLAAFRKQRLVVEMQRQPRLLRLAS